jgi:CBS domain containing-hemolysin-like protein
LSEAVYLEFGGILLCILFSSLFSGAETALTSLHDARLEQLILRHSHARLLRRWRDAPGTVLSFLLVGNTLVNILASSLATDLSMTVLADMGIQGGKSLAIAIAAGATTFVILVFGEVLPKTYARHNPHHIVPLLPLLTLLYVLLWIPARLLGQAGVRFVAMAGQRLGKPAPSVTEEELEYLIRKGKKEGALDEEKERMLSGVLSLQDRTAREIMIPRTDMVSFEVRDPLAKVVNAVAENQFSRYPVYQDMRDKIVGIFHARDLVTFMRDNQPAASFKLRNFVRAPYFVPETKRLDELLKEFQEEHVHMAIVVDEYGGTAGLVTLEDVLEDLIGEEIYDEHDEEDKLATRGEDGSYLLNSRLPVQDIKEELGVDVSFPDDRDYESVGGLVMELAGSVPAKGETFTYAPQADGAPSLHFTVMESDGAKLGKVKMVVVKPDA